MRPTNKINHFSLFFIIGETWVGIKVLISMSTYNLKLLKQF